jgi:hypothetical protein
MGRDLLLDNRSMRCPSSCILAVVQSLHSRHPWRSCRRYDLMDEGGRSRREQAIDDPMDGGGRSRREQAIDDPTDGGGRSRREHVIDDPMDGGGRSRREHVIDDPMDGGGRSRREHVIESNAGAIAECVPFKFHPRISVKGTRSVPYGFTFAGGVSDDTSPRCPHPRGLRPSIPHSA